MEFTKDELYEIEKVFDIWCDQQMQVFIQRIKSATEIKADKLVRKLFDEMYKMYDLHRTISAKCEGLRRDDKGNNVAERV